MYIWITIGDIQAHVNLYFISSSYSKKLCCNHGVIFIKNITYYVSKCYSFKLFLYIAYLYFGGFQKGCKLPWRTLAIRPIDAYEKVWLTFFREKKSIKIIRIMKDYTKLSCYWNHSGPSWWWSYNSWIYNYICNQCLSSLTLWVGISLRRGVLDTTVYVIKFVSDLRHVDDFLRVLWFPPLIKLTAII